MECKAMQKRFKKVRPTINVKETALIIIDVINACCHSGCETKGKSISFKKIRRMIPKLEKFIAKYREKKGKIIFVKCTPWTRKFLAKNIVELYKDPKCAYYSTDATGFSEKFFELKPEKYDLTITKNTYDAFTNPALERFLKKHEIKYVAVTGVFGDGCVHATIQGGFSAGYNFIILKDLIETTDDKERQEIQKAMKKYTWPTMFGRTINSKDFFKQCTSQE